MVQVLLMDWLGFGGWLGVVGWVVAAPNISMSSPSILKMVHQVD